MDFKYCYTEFLQILFDLALLKKISKLEKLAIKKHVLHNEWIIDKLMFDFRVSKNNKEFLKKIKALVICTPSTNRFSNNDDPNYFTTQEIMNINISNKSKSSLNLKIANNKGKPKICRKKQYNNDYSD